MRISLARLDDPTQEPPTEELEERTMLGAPATTSMQHLQALLATLAPLRSAYAGASVERLRALPPELQRALVPQLLRVHPDLADEIGVRTLAAELRLDVDTLVDRPDVVGWLARISGVHTTSAADALDRVEAALRGLATGVAALARGRGASATEEVPSEPDVLLSWALDPTADDAPDDAARTITSAIERALASIDAARADASAHDACDTPAEIEARAAVPRWWPPPFRAAALWSHFVRERSVRERP